MNCKNCYTKLSEHDDYCRNCGGRVIRNRLSFKNLFEHISETFFNYDNKLLRTFIDLLTKPEAVIDGYVKGIRKRYVNPLSYLGIALTLSGITFFLMKKANFHIDVDVFNQGMDEATKNKIGDMSSEYSSFFFLSYIPILVISSWLILKEVKYNFTERTVTFIYGMAEFSLMTTIPSILVMFLLPEHYMSFSFFSLLILGIYLMWLLYRLSKLKGITFFAQILVFLFLFVILFFGFYLAITVIGFLTGELNIQDFAPKK
ncbi:DUF3667 domain-containing protein [Winogradskyella poriferorum]|uniref:DUF3667 domain-containing protein n=1 Tax=Winogradskyella poriferorum TaxID=307627 RepID=UPI003D645D42